MSNARPMSTTPDVIRPLGLAALLAGAMVASMAIVGIAVLLPGITKTFTATPNAALLTQLAAAMAPFTLAVGAPVVGWLIDRVGYRSVYLGGLAIFVVAGCAPAFLDSLWLILIARAAVGLAAAAALISGLTGIGGLPPGRRAQMLGLYSVGGCVAAIALYPLVGAVAQHGWRPGFFVHLLVLVVVPMVLTLPKGIVAHRPEAVDTRAGKLGLPVGILLVAAFAGMVMFISGMFAPFYLGAIGISNPALFALPPMVSSGVGLIAAGGYGWLHARMSRTVLFTLAMGAMGAGLLVSGFAASLVVFIVGAAIYGFGVSLFSPNLSAEAIARAPEGQSGRAVGLASGATLCSQVVFPFIAVPLVHSAGPRGVYVAFACVSALTALGFAWIAFRNRGVMVAGGAAPAHPA